MKIKINSVCKVINTTHVAITTKLLKMELKEEKKHGNLIIVINNANTTYIYTQTQTHANADSFTFSTTTNLIK